MSDNNYNQPHAISVGLGRVPKKTASGPASGPSTYHHEIIEEKTCLTRMDQITPPLSPPTLFGYPTLCDSLFHLHARRRPFFPAFFYLHFLSGLSCLEERKMKKIKDLDLDQIGTR